MKNTIKLFGIIAFTAVIGFSMITCYDGDFDAVTNVYVAGTYLTTGNSDIACYWKDGVRTDLSDGGSGYAKAKAMTVSGDSIYIAGWRYDMVSYQIVACYWKDGVRTDLQSGFGVDVYAIAVSGNSVYVAGNYSIFDDYDNGTNVACYWKDGVKTDLHDGTYDTHAYAIGVLGNSVYVAGYYMDWDNSEAGTRYWENGVETDLENNYYTANAIAVSENSVYVAGSYFDDVNYISLACYWEDGVRTDLPDGGTGIAFESNASARAIAVSESAVYVAGTYLLDYNDNSYIACYWEDGVRTDLSDGTVETEVTAIAVFEGSVYVTGYYKDIYDNNIACYWKDGVKTDLSGGREAIGIALLEGYVHRVR